MITNFEEITANLTNEEIAIVPIVIDVLRQTSMYQPCKALQIVSKVRVAMRRSNINNSFNEPKLRKYVNYIRVNSLLPLIATKNGYFITYDKTIIQSQIQSLIQRSRSIERSANGLTPFL